MKPRIILPAILILFALVLSLFFFFRRDPGVHEAAQEITAPQSESAAPAQAAPASTPFWDDPVAEQERLRPPNPPAPEISGAAATENQVVKFSGVVLNAKTMRPIEGALITQYLMDRNNYHVNAPDIEEIGGIFTGTEGRFLFAPMEVARERTLAWIAEREGFERRILLFPGGEGQGDRLRTTFLLGTAAAIEGRVVDANDKPISGAFVGDYVLPDAKGPVDWTATSSFAHSNGDGHFVLKYLDESKSYRLPASADGFVPMMTEPIQSGRRDVRIVLERAEATVAGRVVLHDESPAVGARVTLRRIEPPQSSPLPWSAASNGAGEFAFKTLTRGQYVIKAELDRPEAFGVGCFVEDEFGLLPGMNSELTLKLPGPAVITGRFVDEATGEGVSGVVIQQAIDDASVRRDAHQLTTDETGAFEFNAYVPDVPTGYEVRQPIELPGEYIAPPPARDAATPWIEQQHLSFPAVRAGESYHAEFALARGARVTGEVIEPDGTTAGAHLPVFVESPGHFMNVVTDSAGKFNAVIPPAQETKFEVSSENGIANAIVDPRRQQHVRIQLRSYGSLQGVVKNSSDEPQPDLEVRVARPSGRESYASGIRFEEFTFAGADGAFEIEKVAPGRLSLEVLLSSSSPYMTPRPMRIDLQPGEAQRGIELILEEGDYVDGTVVNAISKEPISDVTLTTSIREVSASSDEQGRFRLHSIPVDAALDYVTATKRGYAEKTVRNVSFYAGDLVIQMVPSGKLGVRAVEETGAPIRHYHLRLIARQHDAPAQSEQIALERVVSDTNGLFETEELAEGEFRVEVVEFLSDGKPGRSGSQQFALNPAIEPLKQVTVVVSADAALGGIVVDAATEAPESSARVILLNPPASLAPANVPPHLRSISVNSSPSGLFDFGPVPAGVYRLRAESDHKSSREVIVEHRAGGEAIVIELAASPRVFGTVIGTDGKPIKSATMFFMPSGQPPTGEPLLVNNGAFDRMLAHAGRWTIAASDNNSPNETTRELELAEGESRELTIDFSKRIRLTGVIRVDGEPADRNTAILLRSTDFPTVILNADPQAGGEYSADLFAGDYAVSMMRPPLIVPLNETLRVTADSKSQSRDFLIRTGKLEIVAVSPGGELTIEAQSGGAVIAGLPMKDEALRPFDLPAGSYRGIIVANGEVHGRSSWTAVVPGGKATMIIELVEAEPK